MRPRGRTSTPSARSSRRCARPWRAACGRSRARSAWRTGAWRRCRTRPRRSTATGKRSRRSCGGSWVPSALRGRRCTARCRSRCRDTWPTRKWGGSCATPQRRSAWATSRAPWACPRRRSRRARRRPRRRPAARPTSSRPPGGPGAARWWTGCRPWRRPARPSLPWRSACRHWSTQSEVPSTSRRRRWRTPARSWTSCTRASRSAKRVAGGFARRRSGPCSRRRGPPWTRATPGRRSASTGWRTTWGPPRRSWRPWGRAAPSAPLTSRRTASRWGSASAAWKRRSTIQRTPTTRSLTRPSKDSTTCAVASRTTTTS
mmetsp:Transcript_95712/g.297483  ORF Transcript_95712/g.297483 Transcript_95712/m.297483 type:complete len:316 (-) Transcript_95712:339-1286(-)